MNDYNDFNYLPFTAEFWLLTTGFGNFALSLTPCTLSLSSIRNLKSKIYNSLEWLISVEPLGESENRVRVVGAAVVVKNDFLLFFLIPGSFPAV